MAKLAQHHLAGVRLYGLDPFQGMPETDKAIDGHHVGDFNDVAFDEVGAARRDAGLDNLHFIRGVFEDTPPDVLRRYGAIRLTHIDCDIYHPARYACDQVAPVMTPGGNIVFDDATEPSCLGATRAVEDIIVQNNLRSEQIFPHFVFRYPPLPDV